MVQAIPAGYAGVTAYPVIRGAVPRPVETQANAMVAGGQGA